MNVQGTQLKKLDSELVTYALMKTKLEILKIKGEINKIESKSTLAFQIETRSWHFGKENTDSLDKVVAKLTKKERRKSQNHDRQKSYRLVTWKV